jgi:hypothetical protein
MLAALVDQRNNQEPVNMAARAYIHVQREEGEGEREKEREGAIGERREGGREKERGRERRGEAYPCNKAITISLHSSDHTCVFNEGGPYLKLSIFTLVCVCVYVLGSQTQRGFCGKYWHQY